MSAGSRAKPHGERGETNRNIKTIFKLSPGLTRSPTHSHVNSESTHLYLNHLYHIRVDTQAPALMRSTDMLSWLAGKTCSRKHSPLCVRGL